MKTIRPGFLVLVSILILAAGCGGGSEKVMESDPWRVVIATTPEKAAAEEQLLIKVHAQNESVAIRSVAIDFEGDGTWDDVKSFDAGDALVVDAEFSYFYETPGTYIVRVEVRDVNDQPTIKTMTLSVGAPRNIPVGYFMLGVSAEGGVCNAQGLPACSGCAAPLTSEPSTAVRRSLGMFAHGDRIHLAQGFSQWPYANGQDVLYACSYELRLVAGALPLETAFGTGTCATNSSLTPAVLTCSIIVEGTVP